jgi:hypothetical protein
VLRSSRAFIAVLSVFLALPLVLAACGGDGNEDEDQITEVIETSATTNDPKNCTELQTQQFSEQTQLEKGQEAVESCEREAREGGDEADSVEVSNVQVNGESATAEAAVEGSSLDNQTIEVSLVKEGDQWKLDRLERFIDFDGDAFRAAFKEELTTGDDPATEKQADCFVDALGSDQEIQDAFVSGDSSKFEQAFLRCARS